MIVNNFKYIKHLLKFENEMDYYFIQIFKRRKDHPDLKHPTIRLKSYCVYSIEEFENLIPKIIDYCNEENARAYIRLNKQNAEDVTLRCISFMIKNLRAKEPNLNRKVWDSESGRGGENSFWILDVDKEHLDLNPNIIDEISEVLITHFYDERDMILTLRVNSTKSGVHILVPPFDKRILSNIDQQFSDKGISQIQILKDANTLLYAI